MPTGPTDIRWLIMELINASPRTSRVAMPTPHASEELFIPVAEAADAVAEEAVGIKFDAIIAV